VDLDPTYDTLLTQSLVNAMAVASPDAQRPLRPGDALELEARRAGPGLTLSETAPRWASGRQAGIDPG
jgi:hypothetical protein